MPRERTIATEIHGRYLIDWQAPGRRLVFGFHGYAESAESELKRLQSIEGSNQWALVAIQGLHRFYRGRSTDVVASWMTRQDRELAIADNVAYCSRVVDAVWQEYGPAPAVCFSGFSQGVAMAFRTACQLKRSVAGVIALGGDIPPELDTPALARIPAVLIGRGVEDEWYTEDKLAADEARLHAAGVSTQVLRFNGGHEWTDEFAAAAAAFLAHR